MERNNWRSNALIRGWTKHYGYHFSNIWKERYKKIEGTSKVQPLFLWEGKGVETASDIYKKLIIYRNDSVSMRLQDVLKESSERVDFNGNPLFDARWLANMPQNVWDCVRETKLKC